MNNHTIQCAKSYFSWRLIFPFFFYFYFMFCIYGNLIFFSLMDIFYFFSHSFTFILLSFSQHSQYSFVLMFVSDYWHESSLVIFLHLPRPRGKHYILFLYNIFTTIYCHLFISCKSYLVDIHKIIHQLNHVGTIVSYKNTQKSKTIVYLIYYFN